jgi:hypothetical protein
MENSLWSFGCSFTAEYEPIGEYPLTTYDFYKEWRGGNLPSIWPTLLSKKLNLKNKNKGSGAISNYRIFYNFCDSVSEIKKGDVVIIQWTTPYRFLYPHQSGHLVDILPSQEYNSNEYDVNGLNLILVSRLNPSWIQELVHYTKIINEVCKEKQVNNFYWTYSELEVLEYMYNFDSKFDKTKIITTSDNNLMSYLSKTTNNKHTIIRETNDIVKDAHLGEIGHRAQAEYFYNFIKNKI